MEGQLSNFERRVVLIVTNSGKSVPASSYQCSHDILITADCQLSDPLILLPGRIGQSNMEVEE